MQRWLLLGWITMKMKNVQIKSVLYYSIFFEWFTDDSN